MDLWLYIDGQCEKQSMHCDGCGKELVKYHDRFFNCRRDDSGAESCPMRICEECMGKIVDRVFKDKRRSR